MRKQNQMKVAIKTWESKRGRAIAMPEELVAERAVDPKGGRKS